MCCNYLCLSLIFKVVVYYHSYEKCPENVAFAHCPYMTFERLDSFPPYPLFVCMVRKGYSFV